jgi:hypothetical protein
MASHSRGLGTRWVWMIGFMPGLSRPQKKRTLARTDHELSRIQNQVWLRLGKGRKTTQFADDNNNSYSNQATGLAIRVRFHALHGASIEKYS